MGIDKLWQLFRSFLFSKANKEFLIFLFFLALSGAFWLFTTLNETYEREFVIPVKITGVPKNVVLTSDQTDTVRMTIRDKGTSLMSYMYGNKLKNITINFKTYARSNGTGLISAAELQKAVYQQIGSMPKIVSSKPERLEFYYNFGTKKKVPVRWSGRVIPDQLYFLSRVQYWPDSVDVYANESKLDSIRVVYTEQLNCTNFRDTLMVNAHLAKTKGVKTIPETVRICFYTDVLTDEIIQGIPIQSINLPKNKILRTFPSKISVRFVTGANVFSNLKPEDFLIVADYSELQDKPSDKCHIYLKKAPAGISRVKLETNEVDYLIEETSE